ncbi:MAG: ATPase domain-containing protein [Terracidiphilus sp.]|jgi:KaiC/GvpD/RAD55 family RecA-like ATPase
MDDAKVFLHTGDPALNDLLAADRCEEGLCVGRAESVNGKFTHIKEGRISFNETSVVLIEGGAGTGKTTLALQIASAVAKEKEEKEKREWGEEKWSVFFLSLEQTAESIRNVAESFGFGEIIDMTRRDSPSDAAQDANKVLCCRLSPLPLSEQQAEAIFETRFAELQHMVLKQYGIVKYNALFVIDSLSAFTGHPLTRSQLYQLFSLFRTHKTPLIVTLEQPEIIRSGDSSEFETPCFLADIVIKLTREPGSGYLQFFLEVSKSRVCRQGLGKHLYKTRTEAYAEETGTKDARHRTGLVVYPSVHFIISQSRIKNDSADNNHPDKNFIISKELHEKNGLDLEQDIKNPACFALQGPAGTHKLALGLNLGISYVDDADQNEYKNRMVEAFHKRYDTSESPEFVKSKLLVVTFGGQGAINFKGVAWLESQRYLYYLNSSHEMVARETQPDGTMKIMNEAKGTKAELRTYGADNYESIMALPIEIVKEILKAKKEKAKKDGLQARRAEVTVLTFQIGVLTPEECIYRINKVVEDQKKAGSPFHSVLISDTAELCTGFPLLSRDPMFFAALLDLFETKGMLTVGLGVLSTDSPNLREINLALMAKATHRMRFYHYPDVEKLMEGMVNRGTGEETASSSRMGGKDPAKPLTEQLVSVVIDNVTGKNYKRQPKWISVGNDKLTPEQESKLKRDDPIPKLLKCLAFDDPKIE